MKKLAFLLTAALPATALIAAPIVDGVTCRQNWPWSTDVAISYTISGVEAGKSVDVTLTAYNGSAALEMDANGLVGDRYGVGNGTYTIKILTSKAFGATRVAFADFKVKVAVTDAPESRTEVLYKIFDLDSGACTDVTRADLMNGKYGAYETSYGANIGKSPWDGKPFKTDLEDVMIWTGVTNDIAYKTDKLVMRKIKAKDVIWQSGDPQGAEVTWHTSAKTQYWNKFTYDYYIGVFEVTLAQWKKITGAYPKDYTKASGDDDFISAANMVHHYDIVGNASASYDAYRGIVTGENICFPTNSYLRDVAKGSAAAVMWTKTGVEFTLPTIAEWEFACEGGNSGVLYSGLGSGLTVNKAQLGWSTFDAGGEIHRVGEKPCNAYGLYDMLGNTMERVLGIGDLNQGGSAGSGDGSTQEQCVIDPLGDLNTNKDTNPFICGGCWSNAISDYGSVNSLRHASRHRGSVEWYATRNYIGFRFAMPARADGKWADHPTK